MMNKIPLVDLKAQYTGLKAEIDQAIQRVIDATAFINGPDVEAFEQEFAQFCGARHAVGVSSGTSALQIALEACGVGTGDEVITVAHTFCATAEAIIHAGATPVFVDIDPRTYTLDPDCLEPAITPRTKAILPVHLYGQPADMNRINAIARRHGLIVIEDAAQAHGAKHKGRSAGTLGRVACFSFYPGKNLGAYGDAGALTTDDPIIAERARALRDHGRKIGSNGKRAKYEHDVVGYGERLDTLQAAILRAKLPHLNAWNAARRRIAERYCELLTGWDAVLPATLEGSEPVYHLFVVRVQNRDDARARLAMHHIESGVHYPVPLHLQKAYAYFNYRTNDLPHTERAAREVLSLPIYPELSEAAQDRVVLALREVI